MCNKNDLKQVSIFSYKCANTKLDDVQPVNGLIDIKL